MTSAYDRYRAADLDVPRRGLGLEPVRRGRGQHGQGRRARAASPSPSPDADHMLVRIDSVGLCFSDVKIIRQGGSHPKLYNRDLSRSPPGWGTR